VAERVLAVLRGALRAARLVSTIAEGARFVSRWQMRSRTNHSQERGHYEGSELSYRGELGERVDGRADRLGLSHKRLVLGLWLGIWIAAFAAIGPAGSEERASAMSPLPKSGPRPDD